MKIVDVECSEFDKECIGILLTKQELAVLTGSLSASSRESIEAKFYGAGKEHSYATAAFVYTITKNAIHPTGVHVWRTCNEKLQELINKDSV